MSFFRGDTFLLVSCPQPWHLWTSLFRIFEEVFVGTSRVEALFLNQYSGFSHRSGVCWILWHFAVFSIIWVIQSDWNARNFGDQNFSFDTSWDSDIHCISMDLHGGCFQRLSLSNIQDLERLGEVQFDTIIFHLWFQFFFL